MAIQSIMHVTDVDVVLLLSLYIHRKEVAERKAQRNREYDEDEDHDRRDERKMAHLLPPRHDR